MSVCGQTEDASASEEMGAPIREIYEQKAVSKVVRVLTVLAYLLSVSLAAILLSIYYICVWKSPDLPLMIQNTSDTKQLDARRGELKDYIHAVDTKSYSGGSNITVNNLITEPTPTNISEESTTATNTGPNETISDESMLLNSPSTLQTPYNGTLYDIGMFNETDTIT
ncbi:uncharacterized protein LOC113519770 isoform X2 [Galleria mellonella]|uniref:Uncharacterized protein LOC113519770 isoform X2 n=1 Tax=Galleria mellonella TaxID=7137 RepID=A0A6J1WX69_GALME|nr:uncharacterized protein LOC113519770 isoform X2 [Galleria mellonella]